MSPVQASCPACGGPVQFKIGSSIVTVCEYCRSVIARGDRQFEDLGKVADLVDTGSPLELWMKGRYQGVPFELTGRAQLAHPAGGMWDEWYAAFADGRWGWLAEAQGRFYMTFQQEDAAADALPILNDIEVGDRVTPVPGSAPLTIAEKSQARAVAAQGEIPYRLTPDWTYDFVDLSGPAGEFGTIDYGEIPPRVYLGREATLADLGVADRRRTTEREARRVAGVQLSCPHCGGPLDLRAPDRTERVVCPNCAAMLDASQGNLRFLKVLEKENVTPALPLGSVGKLPEGEMTVIGFLVRSVKIEGKRYFWEEFLLYEPKIGFRWMVCSDDHWNYVKPVPAGEVKVRERHAYYHGTNYWLFQRAPARVDYVLGEFYWKVEQGEKVLASDYVRQPEMLSCEVARGDQSSEINWSMGTYLTPAEVARAFAIKSLSQPSGIAPNQPFGHKRIYLYWGLLSVVAILIWFIVLVTTPHRQVFEQHYELKPLEGADKTEVFFSEPFELRARQNVRVTARSYVDNSWVYVEGDLINEDTDAGLVQPFSIPVEYYHGVEDGESWSEGNQQSAAHVSALPAGKYILRLEVQREHFQQPGSLEVRVEQGVPNFAMLGLVLVLLAVVPALVVAYHIYFENRRWQDSYIGPVEIEEEIPEVVLASEGDVGPRPRRKKKKRP